MLRWLRELWIGSDPVEFESTFSLAESIERLRAATGRSFLSALTRERATGTVRESQVSLQRTIPMVGNSFKPFFRGRFVQKNGRVFLIGRFAIHWAARAFMTFWFGFLFLMALLVTIAPNMTQKGSAVPMFLGMLGMIFLGFGLIRLSQWFARNDVSWLAGVIRHAIAPIEGASGTTPISSAPDASSRSPLVILWAAAVLALVGIMGLLTAFRSGGLQPTAPGSPPREFAAAHGALTLVLAFGVFTRRLIAWRAFFVFLAVVWVDSAYRIGLAPSAGIPRPLLPVIVVLLLVVVGVWGLWWYGLRKHFTK